MTALTRHLITRAASPSSAMFAADVSFSSPYADYADRELIIRIFSVMPWVFDELRTVRVLRGEAEETATIMRGRIGDQLVDVILDENTDDDGLLEQVTLFLRPLAAIEEAVRRMKAALG